VRIQIFIKMKIGTRSWHIPISSDQFTGIN